MNRSGQEFDILDIGAPEENTEIIERGEAENFDAPIAEYDEHFRVEIRVHGVFPFEI
jgi:hypothetical protein